MSARLTVHLIYCFLGIQTLSHDSKHLFVTLSYTD
uniref:Uncharacterized protein n=1 Tax=Arundo donax TaxID=35708 RepID=A0A0A8XS98_ARUDO